MGRAPLPALAALLVVQLLFGSMPVVGKLALPAFGAAGVVFFRIGGAAVAFLLARRALGAPPVPRADLPRLLLCTALGITGNQLLFMHGLARTSTAHAALVTATIPALTWVAAVVLGHERLDRRRLAGLAVAFAGVATLVTERDPAGTASAVGDLLILANATVYSFYLVLSRDLVARLPALTVLSGLFGWGFVGLVPFSGLPWPEAATPAAWAAMAYLVVGPTIGTYGLNLYALRHVPASAVAVFIYLQPVIAAALAVPVLGEVPSARALGAAAVVFAGVALATTKKVATE